MWNNLQDTHTEVTHEVMNTVHTISLVNAMAAVRPHHRKAVTLGVMHDLIANIMVLLPWMHYMEHRRVRNGKRLHLISWLEWAWLTYAYTLHHALVGYSHQLPGSLINLSNKEGLVEITVETILINSNVHYRYMR